MDSSEFVRILFLDLDNSSHGIQFCASTYYLFGTSIRTIWKDHLSSWCSNSTMAYTEEESWTSFGIRLCVISYSTDQLHCLGHLPLCFHALFSFLLSAFSYVVDFLMLLICVPMEMAICREWTSRKMK